MELEEFFKEYPKVALAFSGGVDSAYLLYKMHELKLDGKAYFVHSNFQPEFEYQDAIKLAKQYNMDFQVIDVDVLEDSTICENPSNRCYFCKNKIFHAILDEARKDGYLHIIDGTNASDDVNDRPGMKALEQLHVLSPLRICGLTKPEIRKRSKQVGLFTYNKPSYACLATRIPYGQMINQEKLTKTEWAENYLHDLGFIDFRVRMLNDIAKIQILSSQFELFMEKRNEIYHELKKNYSAVLLDLEARDE